VHALTLVVLAAVAAAPAVSAQEPSRIFDRLDGEWRGEGTLMERPATFTMRWQHADGFALLTFANAFADSSGRAVPVLNAAAVYRTSAATPEGVWLDSRGVRVEIHWHALDSALVSEWTAPTERGRTTYRVLAGDELEVVDEVMGGDGLRTFGRARYRRAGGPPS
jgi:hypothetical protein